MDSVSKEIAAARQIGAPGAVRRKKNDNLVIWVIIIIIIFCLCNGDGCGFGSYGCDYDRKHHHHHHHHHGHTDNFFSENGWFILIILAILILFNDSSENTNIINLDTDDDC